MTIGKDEIKALLEKLDDSLETPQTICLIGSIALILMGHAERNTQDIDVWAQASDFDEIAMRHAAENAGLLYNPLDEIPELPYIQIVHPGIVQVPGYDAVSGNWFDQPPHVLWKGRHLTVQCPPPEVIVASKLRRFSDRDVTDSIWLISHSKLAAEAIMEAVKLLPETYREDAEDNLAMLKAIM
ncbi:DUF6036 family nucleotidyltransferase [Pelagibacterium mangrovi]|uniref:DUF6036 family nucleotidyltransferase n=1 Tax=Pelagibacterium mangrovi TaxID=3119828 RepID=UPI002FC58874